MLSNGDAAIYYEPESTVISRSGDECIVALTDQWYLGYGEADWRDCVMEHVSDVAKFNSYNIGIRDALLGAVDWLKEWACSREFGLGTQLPWDEKWVIDSLSDSTIYMAYYTIAKFFHGKVENLAGIHGECDFSQFNDIVFDYVFLSKDIPEGTTNIPPLSLLDEMRKEFKYWYPFDLRVSAKDLIPNHLTMCLYNHAEIWKDSPQYWPKGIYCNGHVMVDAEKMSKSKGNFLMLLECVEEFSADATRFALADAGDSLEDSNFDRSVANQAITYLFIEVEWILSVLDEWKANKLRSGELSFMDRAFDNEMDYLIEATKKHFNALCFRDGLHKCWYDMIIARDIYRDFCIRCGVAFHSDIIMRFVRSLILMMQPICPHWSDYLYEKVFDTVDSSYNAPWPAYTQYNAQTRKEYSFLKSFVKNIRQLCVKQKGPGFKKAKVFVADGYEVNKQEILKYMQTVFPDGKFSADFIKGLKSFIENDPALKRDTKILMQFGSFMKNEAEETGVDALQLTVPFDQFAILQVSLVHQFP
jgi:leucyl-tRNA synthetase